MLVRKGANMQMVSRSFFLKNAETVHTAPRRSYPRNNPGSPLKIYRREKTINEKGIPCRRKCARLAGLPLMLRRQAVLLPFSGLKHVQERTYRYQQTFTRCGFSHPAFSIFLCLHPQITTLKHLETKRQSACFFAILFTPGRQEPEASCLSKLQRSREYLEMRQIRARAHIHKKRRHHY